MASFPHTFECNSMLVDSAPNHRLSDPIVFRNILH